MTSVVVFKAVNIAVANRDSRQDKEVDSIEFTIYESHLINLNLTDTLNFTI